MLIRLVLRSNLNLSVLSILLIVTAVACAAPADLTQTSAAQTSDVHDRTQYSIVVDPNTYVFDQDKRPGSLTMTSVEAKSSLTKQDMFLGSPETITMDYGPTQFSAPSLEFFSDSDPDDASRSHVYVGIRFAHDDATRAFASQSDLRCNTFGYSDDGSPQDLYSRESWKGHVSGTLCRFGHDALDLLSAGADRIFVYQFSGTYRYSLEDGVQGELEGAFYEYNFYPAENNRLERVVENAFFGAVFNNDIYKFWGQLSDFAEPIDHKGVRYQVHRENTTVALRQWSRDITFERVTDPGQDVYLDPVLTDVPALYYVMGEFAKTFRNAF